ncbi:Rap1a/Tai family immunity protein [Agrobacterium sp. NPDC089420]|uniref:Rap1a/Tai family immunity protein n=1 Tax=Agrobacterium sp. NPDC089420 TaxID=3363918 RepID=UPI00384A5629
MRYNICRENPKTWHVAGFAIFANGTVRSFNIHPISSCFLVFSGAILLAMGVAWAVPGDETRDWIFRGFELIEALEGRSGDEMSGEAGRSGPNARAIAGVADATSGTQWCGAGQVLPHEFPDRIYTYLKTLSPERLKQNAATLVIDGLAATFPCSVAD